MSIESLFYYLPVIPIFLGAPEGACPRKRIFIGQHTNFVFVMRTSGEYNELLMVSPNGKTDYDILIPRGDKRCFLGGARYLFILCDRDENEYFRFRANVSMKNEKDFRVRIPRLKVEEHNLKKIIKKRRGDRRFRVKVRKITKIK